MIIENIEYKRNRNGKIIWNQIVHIKCDECGNGWDGLYGDRLKKKFDKDLCITCRAAHRFDNGKIDRDSKIVKCDQCGKLFKRYACNKTQYCSKICRDEATLNKYDHLYKTVENNPNEWAYLCGLILGDGWMGLKQKRTAKIIIAFDTKHPELLKYAESILHRLNIVCSVEPGIQSNCQKLNFCLPRKLLSKYNMLWDGDKYKTQPHPSDIIVNNPYFISGLINSDGYVQHIGNHESIRFVNTCVSIVDCMKKSLYNNGIIFSEYSYDPPIHKKTGNRQKRSYLIYVGKSDAVSKLREKVGILKK